MSSSNNLKPITSYGQHGPNPPKVAVILDELNLPHEIVEIPFAEVKKPHYVAINPNGRLPAIQDPNTGLTLWESGAIIEYLIERYDKDHKLSFPQGSNEAYLTKQWLYYQVSGQGPYYGQAAWFARYHPEKLPSALERYIKEILRVTAVLEGHLAKEKEQYGGQPGFDGPWLVGNKLTFADLAFVPWQIIAATKLAEQGEYKEADYPLVTEWIAKMSERESIKKVLAWQ